MKPAATLGDMHSCPIKGHGTTPIVSGSGSLTVNGKPTACVGDTTGCGATIIEGAPVMMANGQLVAFQGSKTSHGGTIISGDSALMLDTGNASIVGGLDEGVAELLHKDKEVTKITFSYGKGKQSLSSVSRHYTDINLHVETKGYEAGENVSIKVDMPDGSTKSFTSSVSSDGKANIMNIFGADTIPLEEI
jgi:uncharacterized Zn-binding protein involved in type VI secretion